MQLSKNLALAEVMRSETAKRKGISNMPTPEHIENFKLLAEKVFQPIREHFGVPIILSSGYRSKELNTAVGGALSSQHCTGEAIDIDMDGTTVTNKQIFPTVIIKVCKQGSPTPIGGSNTRQMGYFCKLRNIIFI